MGLSIQFRDKEQVLEAFNNRKVNAWSIWCSKQFMFKGLGEESLEQILETLSSGSTNAIYTLRVYEDINDLKKIKSNTADDGSFNFRLNDEAQTLNQEQYSHWRNSNAMLSQMKALEAKMDALQAREDEENEEEQTGIGKLLEHPAIAGVAPMVIEALVSAVTGIFKNNQIPQLQQSQPQPQQRGAINGVKEFDENKALEILEKLHVYDNDLLTHLEKLLAMAENNNDLFNTLLKYLV